MVNQNTQERTGEIAARAAVMEIPLYPDLSVRLKKALGYGPHVDILQHLVYWFHPRHPKMQDRWTLYKTFEEWQEECGLAGRQVKKGRKKLGELGLLTWKRGQYGRVHYRLEWLALANILNRAAYGGPIDDDLDDFEDFNPATVGGPIQSDHQGGPFNPAALPVDPIQETTQEVTSGDYLTGNSSLQDAPESLSHSGAPETINDFQDLKEHSPQPTQPDKRHSQDSDTPPEETAASEEVDKPKAPPLPDDANLLAAVREVLDPDSGKWSPVYAELIRKNYGSCKAYSPEGLARNLETEVDLPFAGRKDDLAQCLRYLFWEWSNEKQARQVAA